MILIYSMAEVHFDHPIKVMSVRHSPSTPANKLLIYLLTYIFYLLFIYISMDSRIPVTIA